MIDSCKKLGVTILLAMMAVPGMGFAEQADTVLSDIESIYSAALSTTPFFLAFFLSALGSFSILYGSWANGAILIATAFITILILSETIAVLDPELTEGVRVSQSGVAQDGTSSPPMFLLVVFLVPPLPARESDTRAGSPR